MAIKTLVVDNNPVLLKAICALLMKEGCEVRSAKTGLEALEVLETYSPDIVFTDLIMPLISGEQLCRLLRSSSRHKNVFIVVISAVILEDRERILQNIHCDLCIAKGTLKEIRLHLQEALDVYANRKSLARKDQALSTIIPESLRPSEVTSELLEGRQHFHQILENIDEGILELSEDGKIVRINKAALEILSCNEESLTGKIIDNAVDWGDFSNSITEWRMHQLVGRGGKSLRILEDNPLLLKQKVIVATFVAVTDAENSFGLCILRDISRQFFAEKHSKELDDAVKLVRKMDALSCMAGGLAHDFNNLLTVICGNLDIMSVYGDKQPQVEKDALIEQTRKSAFVAVDLTRQISCFSNFGIVSREKVSFHELVREGVDRFYAGNKGLFVLDITGDDMTVEVDLDEIYQAIENVLQNGVESSPHNSITITAGETCISSPKLISGQFVPAGRYAKIDIIDSGLGIDKDAMVKVFDPYYSTKERGVHKGMGLGLTIVYATMRNHGGYVIVESKSGKQGQRDLGTTVSLFLPVQERADLGNILPIKEEGDAKYILLLEPDPHMREIGKIMVSYLGFEVISAETRKDALSQLEKLQKIGEVDLPLAIIDASERHLESPIETCRQVKKIFPEIKVIAMSGTSIEPLMEKCLEHGFVNSITKPYTMNSLKHIVQNALQE